MPVNGHEAEGWPVAERPLEVVEQRPVQVAPHVDPFGHACLHLAERGVDEGDPLLVVRGRDPVLGDQDRDPSRALPGAPDRPAKRLRVVLVAHLRRVVSFFDLTRPIAPVVPGAARSFRPDSKPRVGLDADEVVATRQLEKPVVDARLDLERRIPRLRAVLVLDVRDRQRHANGRARVRPDRCRPGCMRLEQIVDGGLRTGVVIGVPWRIDAEQVSTLAQALRLVDGACDPDGVSQRRGGAVAVALEQRRKALGRETPKVEHPLRQREVMEGQDRRHRIAMARLQHSPVVVELSGRELAFGRLDARPLDAEPEGVHAKARQHGDVVGVPVVEVAGVARRFPAERPFAVLPPPPVAVRVAALDLVGADRRAKQKALGEGVAHPPECSTARKRRAAPSGQKGTNGRPHIGSPGQKGTNGRARLGACSS